MKTNFENGLLIEKDVPLPGNMTEDPFYEKLTLMRAGKSFSATHQEAVAFQKRAMRHGCAVSFTTTHEDPCRPMKVWKLR